MVKGRALARPSERSERFEPLVRLLTKDTFVPVHRFIFVPVSVALINKYLKLLHRYTVTME